MGRCLALSPALTGVSGDGPVSISGLQPSPFVFSSHLRLLIWAGLRRAALCYAMPLRHAVFRHGVLRHAMLCHAVLCHAVLCHSPKPPGSVPVSIVCC